MIAPTYGEKWHGYRSAPRPPRHIEIEMEAAGAAGDDVRLGIARAQYSAWLSQQGYIETPQGTWRPDEADR